MQLAKVLIRFALTTHFCVVLCESKLKKDLIGNSKNYLLDELMDEKISF